MSKQKETINFNTFWWIYSLENNLKNKERLLLSHKTKLLELKRAKNVGIIPYLEIERVNKELSKIQRELGAENKDKIFTTIFTSLLFTTLICSLFGYEYYVAHFKADEVDTESDNY